MTVEELKSLVSDEQLVGKITAPTLERYSRFVSPSAKLDAGTRERHVVYQLVEVGMSGTKIADILESFPCGKVFQSTYDKAAYLKPLLKKAKEQAAKPKLGVATATVKDNGRLLLSLQFGGSGKTQDDEQQ
jgi:hypothetical protein